MREVGETEKIPASLPDRAMPDTVSVASPVLDIVSVWEPGAPTLISPNAKEDGTEIDDAVPVPFIDTLVGLPVALWVMVTTALLPPAEVGEKVTTTSWL
jgi:hypothetical protein